MTPKAIASYKPQSKCKHFNEEGSNFDCDILTECWCCLEKKPCSFYKGKDGVKQTKHVPYSYSARGKITAEMYAKMKAYHYDRSWADVARKFGVTKKQIEVARKKYDQSDVKEVAGRKRYTDEVLKKAVHMHTDGMDWRSIGLALGHSGDALQKRITKDRKKGIYHY